MILLIAFFIPPITKHLQNIESNQKQNPLHILTDILKNPNQVRAITLSGILIMGHFVIIPFIAPSLVSNIGYSQDNIFLIYLVGGALTIVPNVGIALAIVAACRSEGNRAIGTFWAAHRRCPSHLHRTWCRHLDIDWTGNSRPT